ncbi:MAG: acetate--CoA ligase [Gemmatimonadota bacterium]|nr:acetate--CoA ligase [Gemmatimonadota bacterium]MDQ8147019.1 acetate--CoA ligase [Gemmatimonadota bacterium]MDQ8148742.1 acetate--CoA ligase [Gemmatimonadota bacterium]MDQ8156150.1 acetate--CoA ligase [Gemmatimonadota bacterium]MDQ8176434.1 acetate--CoA ligase [Gemmatimonadota bacterium]
MTDIDVLLSEHRRFPPPAAFTAAAQVRDRTLHAAAAADDVGYWAGQAATLHWQRPWETVLDWTPPHARWFTGGQLNVSENCLDRHLAAGRGNKAAIVWEGEPGDRRTLTYWELAREVRTFANVLIGLGVRKGDRVGIYLPLIPEAAIAMLACARIGAIHSVVFGGFSPESLRDRMNDAEASVVITADGGYRRGQVVPLKRNTDKAVAECPSVRHVVVVQRRSAGPIGDAHVEMVEGRDHWYHELMRKSSDVCAPAAMDAEDVLFILYTSGTTGKPKGIVHTTGGYLVGAASSTRMVFDLREDDVFWCTADVGWITGHTYLVYGPLANGATCVMYEGAPDWPERDRFWDLCARHGVTILYTAPTAIRAFMKWGDEHPRRHDLSRLRLLGSVGEPINPEAWIWYHEVIGGGRCPIVDTWWQTETGSIVLSPLPGVTTTKPGSATEPLPGYRAALLDAAAGEIPVGGGLLALTRPWPSMLRTIWGDDARYVQTYFSKWPDRPDLYFPGDGAKRDEDGDFWVLGRVDDVLNVAGHRIGTMEVESALVEHPAVAEAAVVGKAHEVKGQAICAFVTLRDGHTATSALRDELRGFVATKIGALARPDDLLFSADLPKTRSGKIMRRLLRDIAEGRAIGDTTTLADPSVVAALKDQYADQEG